MKHIIPLFLILCPLLFLAGQFLSGDEICRVRCIG